MTRPRSIVNFERCYLGAVVIGAINTVLNWSRYQQYEAVRQAVQRIGAWYLPVTTLIGLLIPLVLWYFAARRASGVAKWIIVVLFVLGAITFFVGLANGTFPSQLGAVLSVVSFVLNAIAVRLLFQRDARAWFGERVPTAEPAEPLA